MKRNRVYRNAPVGGAVSRTEAGPEAELLDQLRRLGAPADLARAHRQDSVALRYLHPARGASGPLRGTRVQAKVAGCVRYSARGVSRRWSVNSRRARPRP